MTRHTGSGSRLVLVTVAQSWPTPSGRGQWQISFWPGRASSRWPEPRAGVANTRWGGSLPVTLVSTAGLPCSVRTDTTVFGSGQAQAVIDLAPVSTEIRCCYRERARRRPSLGSVPDIQTAAEILTRLVTGAGLGLRRERKSEPAATAA